MQKTFWLNDENIKGVNNNDQNPDLHKDQY